MVEEAPTRPGGRRLVIAMRYLLYELWGVTTLLDLKQAACPTPPQRPLAPQRLD